MFLDAYLTPYFPETEEQFNDGIVVMIDVLRASTTVCAALYNNAKEVISADSPEKAVKIYSSLSKEVRFLGGEKNCIKVDGFDAGNSPAEYSDEIVNGKTVILTTTNGTKIFQKAKFAKHKIVGAFVNFNSVLDYLSELVRNNENENQRVTLLCAGSNGRLAYEDTLCAGAYITLLKDRFSEIFELTDTAYAAKSLYKLHSHDLNEFLKSRHHASKLIELGFEDDVNTALTMDLFPVVPEMTGTSIKKI